MSDKTILEKLQAVAKKGFCISVVAGPGENQQVRWSAYVKKTAGGMASDKPLYGKTLIDAIDRAIAEIATWVIH